MHLLLLRGDSFLPLTYLVLRDSLDFMNKFIMLMPVFAVLDTIATLGTRSHNIRN